MVSFSSLLLVCIATAAVWAAPAPTTATTTPSSRRVLAQYSTPTAPAVNTKLPGRMLVTFMPVRDGTPDSGTYSPTDNSFLAVYGWTTSPLTEYYIVESYGTVDPSSLASQKGSVTTDGGTYTILETTRTNEPSIEGTATYQQYWSVRTSHRVSGTITTSNHFNAWAALGMPLGSFNWQLLSIHAYNSSGSASITIESAASTSATVSV